jgi:hypothetical protein
MRNKTLLCLVKVLSLIIVIGTFSSANALQLTLSVPDCPSGQTLVFNSNTNTLSCGGTPTPPANTPGDCSISGNSTTQGNGITAGSLIALTANCNTGLTPISFTWTIPGFGSVGPQTILSTTPNQTTTYTVTPTNSAGTGSAFSTTVYVGSSTPPANPVPSGCSVSQSPNSLSSSVPAGTSVNLAVNCGTGTPLTSCSWNGISSTACSINVTAPSSSTSYFVTPSNANGAGSQISTTVNVTQVVVGQGQNFCQGADTIINLPWPASGQVRPSTNGFGNQKIAFKITVPPSFTPALNINHVGFARIAEVPGTAATSRDITVSVNACDFQSGNYLANGIGSGDTAPGTNFTVNNPNGYFAVGATFNINSGDTFYVNVRNANNGNPSCPFASCDVLFDFASPNRY